MIKPSKDLFASKRIASIVERWFLTEPLLFSVWMTHHLIIDPRIRTIRVRRGRIEYNPEFINTLKNKHLDAVLRCEAVRIILKHPYLRRKENKALAYLASNITLQEYLKTELPLPYAHDIFGTKEFDQQYFELYYNRLQTLQDSVGGSGQKSVGGGQKSAVSGQNAEDIGQNAEDSTQNINSDYCSPNDYPSAPENIYADVQNRGEENTQDWDKDEFVIDRINEKIRIAYEGDRWGNIPGALKERILATLYPKLDYRIILRHFRASILSVNRVLTRMKPSRRYGFLYMGSRRDFTTRLLFAVDVSGSISTNDLARGFSVINQLFKYGIQTIDVIQFDTEIKGKRLSIRRARHEIIAFGRGGTNFSPVMSYIDEHREYDGLIIFTDGYAPVPSKPKNTRTRILWLFNREYHYHRMQNSLRHIGYAAFLKED